MKNFLKNLLVTIFLGGGSILTLFFLIGKFSIILEERQSDIDGLFFIVFGIFILAFVLGIFLVKKFGWKSSAYKILICQFLTNGGFLATIGIIRSFIVNSFNGLKNFELQKFLIIGFFVSFIFFIIGIFLTKKRKLQRQVYGILAPIYIFLGGIILFFITNTTGFIKFFPLSYAIGAILAVIFFVLGILWISEHQSGKMKGFLYFLGFGSLFGVIGLAILIFGYDKNPFVEKNDIIGKNIDTKKFDYKVQNNPNNNNKKLSDLLSSFQIKNELWHEMKYTGDYLYFSNTGLVATKKCDSNLGEKYFSFSPYLTGQDFENYYQKRKSDFEKMNIQFSGIDQKLRDMENLVGSGIMSVYYSGKSNDLSDEFLGIQTFTRQMSSSIYENWIHGKKDDAKKKLFALNKLTDQMLFIDSNLVRSLINVVLKQITYQTIYNISILSNTTPQDRKFLSDIITPKDWHKIAQNSMKYERLMTYHFLDMLEKGDGSENITFGDKKITSGDIPSWLYNDKETKKIIDNNFAWGICDINKKFGKNEKCEFSENEMNDSFSEKLIYFPGRFLQRNFIGKYFVSAMTPRLLGVGDQMKKLQDFEIYLKNNLK